MSTIEIQKTSITDCKTDVVVNAANEKLLHGSGVCGYIFAAAGPEKLQAACNKIGHCDTGNAVITPGFNLSKFIVHAVGPIWNGGKSGEPKHLYNCYKSSLDLAKKNGCHSISFPLISSGIFGYPVDNAWKEAIRSVKDWLDENPDYDMKVVFAILSDQILEKGCREAQTNAGKYYRAQLTRSDSIKKGRSGKF